jgi:hypothetical protein
MEIRRGFFRIENRLMLPLIDREMSKSLDEQTTRRASRTVCNMGSRQVTHSVDRRCTFESFIGLRVGHLVAFPHTLRIGKWLSKDNGWSSSPAT